LRFRHANNEDMNFMADLARTGNGESHWRPKGVKLSANILQRNSRTGEIDYRTETPFTCAFPFNPIRVYSFHLIQKMVLFT